MARVRAESVGVRYLFDRQKRSLSPTLSRIRRSGGENWALRDVSFDVGPGEGVALLGASGSGKSTLLRVISGVLEPDGGRLVTEGPVGSLLSIQAGVMAMLTGRENTMLLGVLAGMPLADARAAVEPVRETSGLGEHYERLVASYSQGMRARLGLAVVEHSEPAVLLLDEVHEALDHEFRDHVEALASAMIERGGIVVATGHDHPMLERFCTRALLLRAGHVVADGEFHAVQRQYLGSRRA